MQSCQEAPCRQAQYRSLIFRNQGQRATPRRLASLRETSGLVLARDCKLDEKLFQDDAGVEQGAALQVQVRLGQHRREAVDAARAEMGVLSPGLVHAEDPGDLTC